MTATTEPGTAPRDALGLLKDREQVAQRLLDASAQHSFDPDTELDWDVPFEDASDSGRRSSSSCGSSGLLP